LAEPLIDEAAGGGVVRRQQKWGVIETARKTFPVACRQIGPTKHGQPRFPQQMVERPHLHGRGGWTVGNHHVDPLNREIGQKSLVLVFEADEVNRFRKSESRFEQLVGNQLGNSIGDSDMESTG
jgi:hypothetical protein